MEDDDGSEGEGALWSVKQKDLKGGDREDQEGENREE